MVRAPRKPHSLDNISGKRFQAGIVLFHAIEKNPPEQIHGEAHLANMEEASAYLESIKISLHKCFISKVTFRPMSISRRRQT